MPSRDQYLEQFKSKLDEWNDEIDKLEKRAREAHSDAKSRYAKQLDELRETRDDAQKRFAEMQSASTEAWDAMAKGAEKAWQAWADAFDEARSKFKRKD